MAQGVCSALVTSLHLTLSILMFHPPSLLFPHSHFETTFPTSTSTTSLSIFTRPESAGLAHFRTSVEEFAYLADPTHSTGYEPKEFDKITFVDGDTTPVTDLNHDSICNFSKNTRENTEQFGVALMLEASVSHVYHEEFALEREIQESILRETVARQRERGKRRFGDQCCRVDVKEKSLGVIFFRLTENSILMDEISKKTWNEELNKLLLVKIQPRENYT